MREFIQRYLQGNNIPLQSKTNKSTVDLILKGYREAGWSASGASKFSKRHFPNKPTGTPLLTYISNELQMKICSKCNGVKAYSEYHSCVGKGTGKSSWCKDCVSEYNKSSVRKKDILTNKSKRRAAKLERTPKWANQEVIREIYRNCPEGYQVDHIIPLQGEKVSGLHIESNLQYLTEHDNKSKSNKY